MVTPEEIFVGSSEMGALMRSIDWSQTPLGAVETWPQSLRSTLSICLNSRFPIAIYWGADFLLLYNDAWRPIVGDKHPWAIGRPAREVWSEIWNDIGPELAGVLATGEGTFHNDELLSMHRFGYTEECFFEYTFNPIQGQGGVVDGVFNVVSETTYRVLNERRARLLRETAAKTGVAKTAEEACALMVEALKSDPFDLPFALLYLIDSDGKHARLGGSTELIQDDRICPEVVDLMAEDSDLWSIARVAHTSEPQVISDLVSRFGKIPGSPWAEPPQEAMVLPIVAATLDKVTGVLVAVASPRRRLDDNYRDFFNQIATQIASAITNAQAYEAERKRAEALAELDRAKTAFFSNVSHEFRTPLTLMLSPLEELSNSLNGQIQPDQWEQLQLIGRNGLRLQKLVNTLLDFSRIEAGRVQASYEPTDLAAYTAELASVFRSLIEQAGMALVIDCPTLPEPVYVDRDMWEKIVLNLISNAFKFTFTGSITVRLKPAGNFVEFSVKDTGVGIPEAELPRLFERFHRVSGTRSRTYEGSGIGLALVQELVKLHGGTIHVTSQVNYGTTFTIALPLGTQHLPQDCIEAPRTLTSTALGIDPYIEEASRWITERSQSSVSSSELSPELKLQTSNFKPQTSQTAHILLADDNADMRDYVKRLLSQDYEVETVSDGFAALEAVTQRIPDLVLSDVMMPGLDGFGLLRELRADPRTKEIPIILLSARAGEESRIEGLEAGADDYLIKPFSARELLARVEANLKLAQLRQAAAQREQALRVEVQAARDRLESVLTRIADQFLALDRDWRYTYVNDRVTEVTGIDRENLLGQNFWELFPGLVGSQFDVEVRRAITEQTPIQFEYFYSNWNRWFENHVYPSVDGVSIIVTEITDRKRAEEDLRRSEAAFRTISNAAPALVWVCSSEGQNIFFNDRWYEYTGQTEADAAGLGWANTMHPDDAAQILPYWNRCQQTGEPYEGEVRYRRHDGEYRWHAFRALPRCNADGDIEAWYGLSIDISDHKNSEQERERFLALGSDFQVITGINGYFRWVSPSFERLLGWTQAEMTSRPWTDFVHPDDINPSVSETDGLFSGNETFAFENRYRHKDGSYRWLLWNARLYPDKGVIYGAAVDITDRKQIEAEREQLLAREQAARQAAEEANRIKDEFLAVLSHELRSPLNPILGWSKLLLNGKLDESKTKQALATIERNAKLQSELIEDLLDVSRILQGKLSLTVNPVNLASIIRAAIETVRLAAEAKSITIETKLDTAVGLVSGDSTRLQQVVWNLLSNAVKFTPNAGRVEVELSSVSSHSSFVEGQMTSDKGLMTNYAQITIRDTGKGISADFLPYVFDYFRQADSATTRQFGGLGLGLAIVRHLVELHGGTVSVASPGVGQGATFTVRIPLMSTPSKENQDDRSFQQSLDLSDIKILIVDDEPDTRELLAFVLEQQGAQVTTATSAQSALLMLPQAKPDVLLSDIGMPDMDGYMLIQQVRMLAPEQGGQIPAIALTAYAGEMNQQQALAAGFQKHVSKPIEPEKLIQMIFSLIKT